MRDGRRRRIWPPDFDTWYNFWLVANNAAGTPSPDGTVTFYLQRDGDPSYGTQLNIGHRNARPRPPTPLHHLLPQVTTRTARSTSTTSIYNDNGQNLLNPTVDTDGDGLPDAWELTLLPRPRSAAAAPTALGNNDSRRLDRRPGIRERHQSDR